MLSFVWWFVSFLLFFCFLLPSLPSHQLISSSFLVPFFFSVFPFHHFLPFIVFSLVPTCPLSFIFSSLLVYFLTFLFFTPSPPLTVSFFAYFFSYPLSLFLQFLIFFLALFFPFLFSFSLISFSSVFFFSFFTFFSDLHLFFLFHHPVCFSSSHFHFLSSCSVFSLFLSTFLPFLSSLCR